MIYEFNGKSLANGLYYFYAGWSSKCNVLLERLEKISKENPNLAIYKVNTTKYPGIKKRFSVTKIPSYLFIENHEVTTRMDGNIDLLSLQKWVKNRRS